jgi:two-component system cell cycle response regulator
LTGFLAVAFTYGLVQLVWYGWAMAAGVCALAGWLFGGRVRRMRRLAEYDELTGVANRRPFERMLAREWERSLRHGYPLSVLFLDVDDFGMVNKIYGHLAGDAALRLISGRIRQTLRGTDIVSRWGGEEFVVLLPDTSVDEAVMTAERIRSVIEQSVVRDNDRTIAVTISMGVSGYPGTAESSAELVRQAIEGQSAAKVRKNAVAVVS